jgi:hypothetical protein
VGLLLLTNIVALPFVVASMAYELRSLDEVVRLTPSEIERAETYSHLQLDVQSLDDVNGTVKIRVSGNHICGTCTRSDRVTFYSIANGDTGERSEGIPASAQVLLPATADTVTATIELPVQGSLVSYPYDTYKAWLGVTYERLLGEERAVAAPPQLARGHLFLDLRNGASRFQMARLNDPDPAAVQPLRAHVEYVEVHGLMLFRPAYLRLIVPLVLALVTAAAFYAVVLRPFNELIINSGALVLGIWGVRALLLGGYPPNTTIVDSVLTLLIVLILGVISLRAMLHMHDTAGLTLLRKPVEKPPGP